MATLMESCINKSLSQSDIAFLIESSQVQISSIEQSKIFPRTKFQRRVEVILGPVDWIATRLLGVEVSADDRDLVSQLVQYEHSEDPQHELISWSLYVKS